MMLKVVKSKRLSTKAEFADAVAEIKAVREMREKEIIASAPLPGSCIPHQVDYKDGAW